MRYFTRFFLIVAVFSFWGNALFSQKPETFGQSTFQPMNLFIVEAAINGETLQPGSEISIFDIDPNSGNQICVGSVLIQDEFSQESFILLKASMDDEFENSLLTFYKIKQNEHETIRCTATVYFNGLLLATCANI